LLLFNEKIILLILEGRHFKGKKDRALIKKMGKELHNIQLTKFIKHQSIPFPEIE
jgi:hypothetical protein